MRREAYLRLRLLDLLHVRRRSPDRCDGPRVRDERRLRLEGLRTIAHTEGDRRQAVWPARSAVQRRLEADRTLSGNSAKRRLLEQLVHIEAALSGHGLFVHLSCV